MSHVTTKLGGLEQSLLPASSFSLPDSAPTVAPFHGFRHLLADLGLTGVKTASPERLVHVVDNGTFLSMGLSSFKSSLTSFYNIPAVYVCVWRGGTVVTQALVLAQNPFCHIPFARKTPRGRETDSTS